MTIITDTKAFYSVPLPPLVSYEVFTSGNGSGTGWHVPVPGSAEVAGMRATRANVGIFRYDNVILDVGFMSSRVKSFCGGKTMHSPIVRRRDLTRDQYYACNAMRPIDIKYLKKYPGNVINLRELVDMGPHPDDAMLDRLGMHILVQGAISSLYNDRTQGLVMSGVVPRDDSYDIRSYEVENFYRVMKHYSGHRFVRAQFQTANLTEKGKFSDKWGSYHGHSGNVVRPLTFAAEIGNIESLTHKFRNQNSGNPVSWYTFSFKFPGIARRGQETSTGDACIDYQAMLPAYNAMARHCGRQHWSL